MTVYPSEHRPFVLHTRVVTGTGGGPEKTILNSPRFLKQWGIDSACMFMKPPGDPGFASLESRAAAAGADIIGVDDRGPLDLNVVRRAVQLCRERGVTIWHGHDYKSNALGLLVRLFHRMKLITTAHGWVHFTSRTPMYYRIDRFCMKRYQRVLCVSEDLMQRCREAGISEDRLTLIDNAIVHTDYDPSEPTAEEKRSLGFRPQQVVLAAVGRLSEEKGFDRLIDAVSFLVSEGCDIGLAIAGEGHLKPVLQDQIERLELQHRVRLTGYLPDPRRLYRAADIYVLSSLREGLPNVVLEAMASGRAVVTTACNGIPRLVQDGHNGLVVPPDDIPALAAGIRRCVQSEKLRRRLAVAARRTVEERFSFEQRMQKVVDAYCRLSPQTAERIRQAAERTAERSAV